MSPGAWGTAAAAAAAAVTILCLGEGLPPERHSSSAGGEENPPTRRSSTKESCAKGVILTPGAARANNPVQMKSSEKAFYACLHRQNTQ